MEQYRVDCEECENTTEVFSYSKPEFCPVCGRRAEIEKRKIDLDWIDEYE